MIWPLMVVGRHRGERWKAINDYEIKLDELVGAGFDAYLSIGDAVETHDGKLWICTKAGWKHEAMVVEGRYKKPTEMFP